MPILKYVLGREKSCFLLLLILITACAPTQPVSLTTTPQFNYTQALIEACQPNDPLFEAMYQIQLINHPQSRWYISVIQQKCTVTPGSVSTPDVTIQMSESDLLQLAQGQIKIDNLLQQGRMTVIGEPQLAAHLPHIFGIWAGPIAISSVTPTPVTYGLQRWMKTNTDYFNGLFFAEAADLADQLKPLTSIVSPTSEMTFDSSELAKTLATYQSTYRQWQTNLYQLDTSSRQVPFNFITHEVIKQKYQQARYEIELGYFGCLFDLLLIRLQISVLKLILERDEDF